MAIFDAFESLLTAQGAMAMGVGAGAGVLVTKKIEHSPAMQAKIASMTARASGQVASIKEKVHPTPSKDELINIVQNLTPEQKQMFEEFVVATQGA